MTAPAVVPRGRLTPQQRADRSLSEIEFQRMLVGPNGLATMLGWVHVHFRPAMTKRGWRTAGTGELAAGWPDLVLLRKRDRRLVFAELKRELEHPTAEQAAVLAALGELVFNRYRLGEAVGFTVLAIPQVEVHVWRPSDLSSGAIAEVLR